jgi:hypothetical protein
VAFGPEGAKLDSPGQRPGKPDRANIIFARSNGPSPVNFKGFPYSIGRLAKYARRCFALNTKLTGTFDNDHGTAMVRCGHGPLGLGWWWWRNGLEAATRVPWALPRAVEFGPFGTGTRITLFSSRLLFGGFANTSDVRLFRLRLTGGIGGYLAGNATRSKCIDQFPRHNDIEARTLMECCNIQ